MKKRQNKEAVLTEQQKKKRRRSRVTNLLLVAILLIGAGIMAYPTVSDWWNSFHQTQVIAEYAGAVEQLDPAQIEAMLDEAEAYNERLSASAFNYNLSKAEEAAYNTLLDPTGNGIMGYVQIPVINVNLPIYHGTDDEVLQVGVGHIEGSSLPIGGESTHTVISSHRGLPRAKLFTDLDKLTEGDTFTITVLNRSVMYEVDQIRIVEPDDFSELGIVEGEDLATLVTCTPYGINTHRLLVRGHRTDGGDAVPTEAVQIPTYIVIPAVAIPMLFVILLGMLIHYRRRTPRYDRKELLRQLSEQTAQDIPGDNASEQAKPSEEASEYRKQENDVPDKTVQTVSNQPGEDIDSEDI